MSTFPLVTAPKNHAAEAQAAYADHSDPEIDTAVRFAVDISLFDLIEADIEILNDMVENLLFAEGGVLSEIGYELAEDNPNPETVRLNVTAIIVRY